jgi:hypothetical protein
MCIRLARHAEALLRIACLIGGIPPEPRLSGVAELISSAAIDADKIDYVNRDASACGIPVGVDVSRVFLRSGFIIATREQLKMANLKDDPAPEEVVFVVNASGMDTVDEITQARAALYQRVYLHAVTRGSEALLARALAANLESASKDSKLGEALGLWSMSDDVLLSKLITAGDSKVVDLGGRLYGRRLLKKACVFSSSVASMHMPVESLFTRVPFDLIVVEKQIVNTPLEALSSQQLGTGRDRELEAEITAEARAVVKKLPSVDQRDLVPRNPLEVVNVLGTAYMDRVRKDCIVLQNGELLRTSNFTPVREQQDAFDIFKAVGYVMCEAEWRPIVLIAARTILSATMSTPQPLLLKEDNEDDIAKQKGSADEVSFVVRAVLDLNAVIRRSGVGRQAVKRVMSAATEGGYFDDKPLLAEPTDEGFAAVRQVAERLSTFEGQRSWRVREETVARFVDQFPPRLRREMLGALARIVFFDATELRRSVLNTAARLSSDSMDIAPLSANSGHHVRMIIEQEAKGRSAYSHLTFRKSLQEALDPAGTQRAIVFVDDNISSATQARAQFLRWVGVSRENWPEECKDEDGIANQTLSEAQLDEFRGRALHIVTCVGRPLAEENLRPILAEHGFATFHGVKWKYLAESMVEWSEDLKSFLCDVGTSLIAWSRYRKDPSALDAATGTL